MASPSRPSKVKKISGERRTRPDLELLISKTRHDIIQTVRTRFKGGLVWAMNAKDAIGQLFMLIKRPKRLITAAFEHMLKHGEFLEVEDMGYRLDKAAA